MGLLLGKIVKADSHIHYVCQIFGPREVKPGQVPLPEHYALGNFVRIHLAEGQGQLIGLIYDTVLLNPDFGNLGPRLSPEAESQIFTPDYLNERAVLVRIVAIGTVQPDDTVRQGVPRLAASGASEVEELSTNQIRFFHKQTDDSLNLTYLPLLMTQDNPLITGMVQIVLDRLIDVLPGAVQVELEVLRDDLLWRSQINTLGGTR